MKIIQAEENDWSIISAIASDSWRVGYTSILSSEQIEFMLAKSYSHQGIIEAMQKGQYFYLLETEETFVGFIALQSKKNHILRIEKLYLSPLVQGLGYGKELLEFAKQRALALGFRILELNVNRRNKAYHFYLKQGFNVLSEVDIPYYNFILDDYIMQKELLDL
ncbi:GNAT family N-acetyltransferase [Sphingobacterium sp. LRF_L2]|uniref:GNAT family N-acetyltransferase n=1 Tax=Sphingobacterium sp. LRF_L2 TaxID=3369421 RepID=UPI003F62242D